MRVTFNQTANHIHTISINGHKAGVLMLLSHNPDEKVSAHALKDWRVFFSGKYHDFQVNSKELMYSLTGITLIKMKDKIIDLLFNKVDLMLPKEHFEDKGFVFANFKNGLTYTISTDYQDKWSEYFHLRSSDNLFASESVLKERVHKLFEYEKRVHPNQPEYWSENKIESIEYKMISPIFDTLYYTSIKDSL